MSNLRRVDTNAYGMNHYHMSGSIHFELPRPSVPLQHGDSITDDGDCTMYVHQCELCDNTLLRSTMCSVPVRCTACEADSLLYIPDPYPGEDLAL